MTPARITWLVGPPGAGKTTYLVELRSRFRVVEFNEMLSPLVDPVRMRKGVRGANGMLVQVVRHLEGHPDNLHLGPIIVGTGIVFEDALFPLRAGEEVWLLLPPYDRWKEQLHKRPLPMEGSNVYDDYAYAASCYEQLAGWIDRGLPVRKLDLTFRPELIGVPTK